MVEISTSILTMEKGEETKTIFAFCKNRLFPYRCNGWKIC